MPVGSRPCKPLCLLFFHFRHMRGHQMSEAFHFFDISCIGMPFYFNDWESFIANYKFSTVSRNKIEGKQLYI